VLERSTLLASRWDFAKVGAGAKRMECVQLAPAFERPSKNDSASKLDALHTLRAVCLPLRVCITCS